jgi:hypothetical protein
MLLLTQVSLEGRVQPVSATRGEQRGTKNKLQNKHLQSNDHLTYYEQVFVVVLERDLRRGMGQT